MGCYSIPHLTRIGGQYYYRAGVPKNLIPLLGRREIKFSLQTSNPITAKVMCRHMSARYSNLLEKLKSMPESPKQQRIIALIRNEFETMASKSLQEARKELSRQCISDGYDKTVL